MKLNEWDECGEKLEWNLWQRRTGKTPKNLPRPRFIHHETHMEWQRREVGTPAVGDERLTVSPAPRGCLLNVIVLYLKRFFFVPESGFELQVTSFMYWYFPNRITAGYIPAQSHISPSLFPKTLRTVNCMLKYIAIVQEKMCSWIANSYNLQITCM